MSYLALFLIIVPVSFSWAVVIMHQTGWPGLDPAEIGYWWGALLLAYPTVLITTGAFVAALLLAVFKK